MFVLGLTGSIAMGKSTASETFRCFGVPVFDADAEVHRLFAPGGAAVVPVGTAFPGCVDAALGIDRVALARQVFRDPAALDRLEEIVHPLVRAAERRFLQHCAAARRPLAVLDIPLLYETGGERLVDAIAVVSAPAFLQAQRVLRRKGMSADRLAAIRRRQLPDLEKRRRADFVIPTGLDRRLAVRAIARIIDGVRGRLGTSWPDAWPDGPVAIVRDPTSLCGCDSVRAEASSGDCHERHAQHHGGLPKCPIQPGRCRPGAICRSF